MRCARYAAAFAAALALFGGVPARAQSELACGAFTTQPLAAPAPRTAASAVKRFEEIDEAVKTRPYTALFLGDSLTERWDPESWRDNLAARGVLNAGVNGDRTEHLLWRLDHGDLAGPPPRLAIVLIGTNDLAAGRDSTVTAEGIRAVLLELREREPHARLLLLGLLPRGATPADRLRQEVGQVNDKIQHCGDNKSVFYADIGGVLLDYQGGLSRALAPDLLHFSAAGYARLTPLLDRLLDPLLRMPPL